MRGVVRLTAAAILSAAVLAVAGCGGDDDQGITVLCGNSFRPAMEKLVEMYQEETGRQVGLTFGESEHLLPHVKDHVEGDIFVSHDPYMEYTEDADSMLRYVVVGYQRPVVVVKKDNPEDIKEVADLARPGLQLALTDAEYSTCGKMVDKLLNSEKYKDKKDAIMSNAGNAFFRSHSEVGTHIKEGHADAGIMWNGMAYTFREWIEVVPTPNEYETETRVAVMGLSYSKKRDRVEHFLKFVDEHGKKVFTDFGYKK